MRDRLQELRRLRLSRRDLMLVALLLALWVAVFMLWQNYQDAMAERDIVGRMVRTQTSRLERLRNLPAAEALRAELTDLDAKLSSAVFFPQRVDTVDLTNLFLQAAQKNRVELMGVQGADAAVEALGKTNYQAVRYSVQAWGALESISGFLKDIEEGAFVTLRTEAISLVGGKEAWDVRFNVVVLAQPEPTPTPAPSR